MPAHKGSSTCTVCKHVERVRIELLLAGGASQTAVAAKYRLSKHAVHRHWANHVSDERRAALALGPVQRQELAARVSEESASVLDHLKAVRAGLYQMFSAALDAGDRISGGLIAGRLHENLNAMARITGQLASSPLVQVNNQTNLFLLPEFADVQATLIRVLAPHPAARADVIRAFRQLEQQVPRGGPALIEHGQHEHASSVA